MATTSTSTPTPSHFLALPTELRLSIYDTLVHSSVTTNLRKHKQGHHRPFKALRNTCQKIKAEVDDYLSSRNFSFHKNFGVFDPSTTTFYLGLSVRESYFEGMMKMISEAPPSFQKGVQHLIVDVLESHLIYTDRYTERLLSLISLCSNLQSLYLSINTNASSRTGNPSQRNIKYFAIELQDLIYYRTTYTNNMPPIILPKLFMFCDGRAKWRPRRPQKMETRTVHEVRTDVAQAWDFNF